MAIDAGVLAGITAGLGALGWQMAKTIGEKRKARDHGLDDNPERCAKHEVRITALEAQVEQMRLDNREDHGNIFSQIGEVKQELGRLAGKINGAHS